jgi:hypothetical protein
LLHNLASPKDVIFSVLYSGSRILLSNPFYRGILSVSTICFLQSCLALYSFCTASWQTNLLKVGLGVPSRGHLVEQFIFHVVI